MKQFDTHRMAEAKEFTGMNDEQINDVANLSAKACMAVITGDRFAGIEVIEQRTDMPLRAMLLSAYKAGQAIGASGILY